MVSINKCTLRRRKLLLICLMQSNMRINFVFQGYQSKVLGCNQGRGLEGSKYKYLGVDITGLNKTCK